jgi:hypothetical protein
MFSYGSGLASSMFSFKFNEGQGPFTLSKVAQSLDITALLKATTAVLLFPYPALAFDFVVFLAPIDISSRDFTCEVTRRQRFPVPGLLRVESYLGFAG